jgi:mannose-6-phosphate isomerase-like protein (cupin superfamily)
MVKYIKQFNLDTPSWDDLLFELNKSSEAGEFIRNISPGFFVSHFSMRIPKVKVVLNELNLTQAHSYINIMTTSETFGTHKDKDDVYFWQVKGKSKWTIMESTEYVLDEGDLIYVPAGIIHNVTPLSVRAGISMSP